MKIHDVVTITETLKDDEDIIRVFKDMRGTILGITSEDAMIEIPEVSDMYPDTDGIVVVPLEYIKE